MMVINGSARKIINTLGQKQTRPCRLKVMQRHPLNVTYYPQKLSVCLFSLTF